MYDNKSYLLALNRMQGIGPRTIHSLITRWPRLEEMFSLSCGKLLNSGLPLKVARLISGFDFKLVEEDLRWQDADSANYLLTIEDDKYPAYLKQIHSPPYVLYLQGDINCLSGNCIAIVGARKPSINGLDNSYKFAFDLAKRQITIVSGLAIGVDAQAHLGAIAANGKTIAVMGTGVDIIYPRRNLALAGRICENGVLISEFPLKTSPIAGHFPRRNRIISGLAMATLVVEAAVKSGSLITARFALEQNREVLAIPGSIRNPQARGCHQLLQQGAKLVTAYTDILDELNLDMAEDIKPSVKEITSSGLAQYIGFEVTSIDQIIARSGIALSEIICDLAKLELKGIVSAVPGGYMRCR